MPFRMAVKVSGSFRAEEAEVSMMLNKHCNKKINAQVFICKRKESKTCQKVNAYDRGSWVDAPDLAKSAYSCCEGYQEKEWNPFVDCANVQGCLLASWRKSLYATS